jgi:CheY-like chemotaxis protein
LTRILIVEDQATYRFVLICMLQRLGHHADVAENGRVAVDLVASHRYDVVFMDVQMPELDGVETTRRIRAGHPPSLRIVGLSAQPAEEVRLECLAAGMDDYFSKPLSAEQLDGVLRDAAPSSAEDAPSD